LTYTTLLCIMVLMAVLIRKFNQREYAYIVRRVGSKIVHKYLGPTDDAHVKKMVNLFKRSKKIPPFLYYLFWDTDPKKINIKTHSLYILERILEMGSLKSMRWAQHMYSTSAILEITELSRSISEKSKNFWKVWFGEVS